MPIYEYRCTDCHQIFEKWCDRVVDGDVMFPCPICRSQAKRLISNTSFSLKGGGWYATEYGTHKNHAVKDSAAGAPSTGGSSDDKTASGPDKSAGA